MTRNRFARVILGHRNDVMAFARSAAKDALEAEDLFQETYARAFAAFRQLRSEEAARTWLFRILHNALRDRRRREHAGPVFEVLDGGQAEIADILVADLETQATARLEVSELLRLLGTLPEEQRIAIWLCDAWEMTYPEIAEVLDCPVGTVRSRIARGRARLFAAAAGDRVKEGS